MPPLLCTLLSEALRNSSPEIGIEDGTISSAQASQVTSLSPWTAYSLFRPVVSSHLEQGEAMWTMGKETLQASCSGKNQADMSFWDGAASGDFSQRPLHRGPNFLGRRLRSLAVLSRITFTLSSGNFSFGELASTAPVSAQRKEHPLSF